MDDFDYPNEEELAEFQGLGKVLIFLIHYALF